MNKKLLSVFVFIALSAVVFAATGDLAKLNGVAVADLAKINGIAKADIAKFDGIVISGFTCGTDTVADADSNSYNTVAIGDQCWMASNMRTTKYPDGSAITKGCATDTGCDGAGATTWGDDTALYSCPPNAANDAEDCAAAATLGMLYQWSAAMDGETSEAVNQGICPSGWHVPTDAEYKTLEVYLGMCTGAGDGCVDADGYRGTNEGSEMGGDVADESWDAGDLRNTGGFDTSGFKAPPAGYRNTSGSFSGRGTHAYFWSSSEYDAASAWRRHLYYGYSTVYRYSIDKAYGWSVRCLKD